MAAIEPFKLPAKGAKSWDTPLNNDLANLDARLKAVEAYQGWPTKGEVTDLKASAIKADGFTVTWAVPAGTVVDSSKGDKGYTVTVKPTGPTLGAVAIASHVATVVLTKATAGTEYTVSVVANGIPPNVTDSDAATVKATPKA
ncbi:fibronectin type III domain-containing protein [Streptomyces sp. NPDC057302]|uniref:fibronectin type III domain-containing protein n=1 Tax=Streptomyces sp. NPDC057302 TaxID=3346094 RepID=UPI0036273D66